VLAPAEGERIEQWYARLGGGESVEHSLARLGRDELRADGSEELSADAREG
jgi:hypothetical protein